MDITLVYFFYGLAFFSMGLAMFMESNRSPLLAQARVLRPLACFGFVHGAHEWLEMFLDKSDWVFFQNPLMVNWLRISILSLSFACLGLFALRALQPQRNLSLWERVTVIGGTSLYILSVIAIAILAWIAHLDQMAHVDAMLRYFVAVPAALLAGVALFRQASQANIQGRAQLGSLLRWAAWGFTLYAFTQAIVPPVDVLPGSVVNTVSFTALVGFPVQVVRAVLAAWITVSLIRATQIVDEERQRQLLEAQQARVEALEKVQQELLQREAMRQELLRHIVIAQEDERARVARELHDEMAQILTGFGLHLAILSDTASNYPEMRDQIDHLKSLSKQMSRGIYRLVHDLRPAQLDDLGLVAALQYLVEDSRRSVGLQAQMVVDGEQHRLDPLVETVLFRGAQEALTNVARHAGVNEATLRLSYEPQCVRMQVEDTGKGIDLHGNLLPAQSWGLAGMRERAEAVGGRLNFKSEPGEGTLVEIVIPDGKENIQDGHSIDAGG